MYLNPRVPSNGSPLVDAPNDQAIDSSLLDVYLDPELVRVFQDLDVLLKLNWQRRNVVLPFNLLLIARCHESAANWRRHV